VSKFRVSYNHSGSGASLTERCAGQVMSTTKSGNRPGGATGRAIDEVLQAEREAAQAVQACERRAQELLAAARARGRRLIRRADQRMSLIQQRCNHRLDTLVRAMQKQQTVPDDTPDPGALAKPAIEAVIAALAAELTDGETADGERRLE
jgi:hypothetical protein